MSRLGHLSLMPPLVRLLAEQVGKMVNITEITNKLGSNRSIILEAIKLLEQLFIFEPLPSWQKSSNKRIIKTPKMHIVDTGLLCALKQIGHDKINNEPHILGPLVESYVINEIKRLASWHEFPTEFSYYRDKDKNEVDFVIENYSGDIVAIEIKAGATIRNHDFNGLRTLKKQCANKFIMGIILYDGDHTTQFENQLYAVPIGSIWE